LLHSPTELDPNPRAEKIHAMSQHLVTSNLEAFQAALTDPEFDPNYTSELNRSPLLLRAVVLGQLEFVKVLLEDTRVEVNLGNEDLMTPLFAACEQGYLDIVKELARHPNIEVNKPIGVEATPFWVACEQGRTDVVEFLLLDLRVDVTRPMNDGASPLFISAQYNHPDVVRLLLGDQRTDPNAPMYDGATPMYIACQEGLTEIVKLLLAHHAVDPERSTVDGVAPFFTASQNGHLDIVQALLADPRVNPEKMRDVGASALMVAAGEGQTQVVKLILATGHRMSLAPTLSREATVKSKSVKADWKEFVAAMPQALISAKDVALVRGQREIHDLLDHYERDPKTVVVDLRRELGFAGEFHFSVVVVVSVDLWVVCWLLMIG